MDELKKMSAAETMVYALTALLSGHNDPVARIEQHVARCSVRDVEKPNYFNQLLALAKQCNLL